MEFTALANHRKAIRAEIAAYAEQFRRQQADALTSVLADYGIDAEAFPPETVLVIITGIARLLLAEVALGVTTGHEETVALVERYLARFEGEPTRLLTARPDSIGEGEELPGEVQELGSERVVVEVGDEGVRDRAADGG